MSDRSSSRHFGPLSLHGRAFQELCSFLVNFHKIEMPHEDCAALAVAAISGHARAEFLVASVYDAAGDAINARIWCQRAADKGFVPAMLMTGKLRRRLF